ncbi:hypothetical protein RchiOBHm_Chr2g0116871 [Rosa chinensis]|uniref:Uncharacterized protein n=1 Tax=Rosa chinensis TaxID=74649 RepID=A0A2P6RRC6_ROSCH|nr:uncharacterized protein LOC112185952 isoform X2 [Rosa chinensis]PRQ48988.1 hypothetical protein RchiOBHm_Chr2g0116871 [Rosa chinensis]
MLNFAAMFGRRRHRAPKSPAAVGKKKDNCGGMLYHLLCGLGSKVRPEPGSKARGSKHSHAEPSHGSGAGGPNNTSARRSWKTGIKSEERKIATSPPHDGAACPVRFFIVVRDDSKDGTLAKESKINTGTLAKESKINTGTLPKESKINGVDESSLCSSDLEVDFPNETDYPDLSEIFTDGYPSDGSSEEVTSNSSPKWIPLDSRFDLRNARPCPPHGII